MRTPSRALVGAAAVALLATACGGGGGGGGGEEAATKSFTAFLGEPEDLIPGKTNESEGSAVDSLLFSALTSVDPKTGESVNHAAESIESDDQKTWTVTLKDGWKFHNGEDVTAASFAGAWNATVREGWDNSYFFTDLLKIEGWEPVSKKKADEMTGLKVTGDDTLEVTLEQPNSNFPLVVGYTAFYPMPESVLEKKNWDAYREAPIGNGPYRMDGKWDHNQAINVKKYNGYKGDDAGKADAISFKIYSNPDTAYNDVTAGNLDVDDTLPTSRLGSVEDEFGDRYIQAPSSSFTWLGFPLWRKEYKDVRVRQAFSMAIDRDEINDKIFNGTVTPAKSLVTPLIKLGTRDDACGESCTFDPDKAKQLLDESGFDKDQKVSIWFNTGAGNEDWVQAVANQLRKNLGVTTELKGQAWAQYLKTTDEHKVTGPYRLGWIMDYASPENYLEPLYGTNGSSNGTGYSNKKVDQALSKGKRADEPEEAVKYYHEAEDMILADMPSVPLWYTQNNAIHSERVSNVTYDAQGYLQYGQIEVKAD